TYTKYMYRTTVRRAKERLDAQGFGLNNFEKIFNDEMVQAVDYSSFLYHLQGDYDEEDKNNEIRIKKNVSLKKWKNAMKKIVSYELANGNISRKKSSPLSSAGVSARGDSSPACPNSSARVHPVGKERK
ncbi:hypothetical protein LEA_04313, partial [human gut metagenome]